MQWFCSKESHPRYSNRHSSFTHNFQDCMKIWRVTFTCDISSANFPGRSDKSRADHGFPGEYAGEQGTQQSEVEFTWLASLSIKGRSATYDVGCVTIARKSRCAAERSRRDDRVVSELCDTWSCHGRHHLREEILSFRCCGLSFSDHALLRAFTRRIDQHRERRSWSFVRFFGNVSADWRKSQRISKKSIAKERDQWPMKCISVK